LYVEPENVDDLVRSILSLCGDANLRSELGKNGREFVVRNFCREIQAREYLDTLKLVLERDNGR